MINLPNYMLYMYAWDLVKGVKEDNSILEL